MKKVGIIGGVGPSATLDLYGYIIKNTPAKRDQDHLRVIIDSNAQIPDRTKAFLENGESPIPQIKESIKILEQAGVDNISCPCNTAHIFLRQIKDQINVDFIDMIDETMKILSIKNIKKTGLLSTSGTVASQIYQETAKKYNIEVVVPSDKEIENEMEAIYGVEGIKAGIQFEKSIYNKNIFLKIIENFQKNNINSVIMGCTEIPLCLEEKDTNILLLNPTEILANAIIKKSV